MYVCMFVCIYVYKCASEGVQYNLSGMFALSQKTPHYVFEGTPRSAPPAPPQHKRQCLIFEITITISAPRIHILPQRGGMCCARIFFIPAFFTVGGISRRATSTRMRHVKHQLWEYAPQRPHYIGLFAVIFGAFCALYFRAIVIRKRGKRIHAHGSDGEYCND